MRLQPQFAAMFMCLGLGIAGCAQGQDMMDNVQNAVHDFNPFGTAKQPLPGERKAMFPEGVPGVHQGVPPHLMQGARQDEPEVIAATPEPAPESRPARQRVRAAAAPPPQRDPPPRKQQRRAAPPAADEPAPDTVWPEPPRQSTQRPPARAAQRPAPAPAPASTPSAPSAGWAPPPQEPVQTQWPDPPQVRQ
jgi:hypothetical protein